MIHITPNYDEMGEFLHEIVKDRSKDFLHISTLPDSEKTGAAICVLHQKIAEEFSKNTLRQLIDKAVTEGKGLFLNTVSTDSSGKRKGENCIDPLAIVADYDYGTEPPTDDRLIELNLPLPTVRVKSGRGDHLWWVLKEDSCTKAQRKRICGEIAKSTGGDEQMKSEARLLRMPGSIHLKDPENPKLVYITKKNYERRYGSSDFEPFLSKLEPKSKSSSKQNNRQPSLNSTTIPPIPIERCLSKAHREFLDTGVSEGIRNQTAISLAKDLLGCATKLEELGVTYDGDPYSIYLIFCTRCSPPIPEQEREATWRSANKGAQSPSINDPESFQNCIDKWNKEHRDNTTTVSPPLDRQVFNTTTLKDDIQSAIANFVGSDLTIQRSVIAKNHGIQISVVKDIERQIQEEIDAGDTDIEELKAFVDKKLAAINNDFPLSKLFPSSIAAPLIEYCKATATPQGLMAMALITGLASLLHPKTHLICLGNTDRIAKAIFWLAIYGPSGTGKSHSYSPILKVIKNLGNSHNLLYEEKLDEWEKIQRKVKDKRKVEDKKPSEADSALLEQSEEPRPVRERYWVSDVTIEALISRCAQQPDRGLLYYSPELLAWCLRMDPAKGEVEYWLCLWDGESVEGDRIGREFPPLSHPSISVMGGVQPDVMAKMITKDEEIQNGFMPRLALVRLEEAPKPSLSKSAPINYSELNKLFKAVADTKEPIEIKLSESCFNASDRWDREMDNLRLAEPRKSIKPLFPKFNGYSYRIALMLHIINRKVNSNVPEEVPLSTFEAAIEFTRWLLAQSISIYEELLGDSKEDTIAKFLNSSKYTDWTTVRQFQKPNWRKVKNVKEARKLIEEMWQLKYIEINGEKLSSPKFRFRSVAAGKRGQVDKTPARLTDKSFESSTIDVDNVDNNSSTDYAAKFSDDMEDVDNFGCDGDSKGFDENESQNLTPQPGELSTISFEEAGTQTATVSEAKQGEMSTASTLPVDSSNDSLKVVSSILSTCPPDSIDENSLNIEGESSDWDNIQEATEDEF
jgi:Protein of unknown function (DUF3987)